ncbi:MAG: redoxin domain-containing protein [Planctomycetia bacterium]|nr:redoxin domain-containing protein [Planctomycetia bacterium]
MMNSVGRVAGSIVVVIAAWRAGGIAAEEPAKVDVGHFKVLDVKGQVQRLDENERRAGTAFVFLSTECPISRKYVPELNRLQKVAAGTGKMALYGILSDAGVTRREAGAFLDEFKIEFPVLFDASGELAGLFQPDHVPQAFLIDSAGAIVYRGRIDDLYADVDKRRAEPTRRDLYDAMLALAEQRPIENRRTEAVGCPFEKRPQAEANARVTYARDVAPLLYAHCAECHRPGEVAPFSLLSYQDAAKRAEGIARVAGKRLMPPWRAAVDYGHFLDERRLSEREIEMLKKWAATGAAEGNADDLPPPPVFASGWRLGEPDAVVEVEVPVEVPADGPDIFQHFVLPVPVEKDEMVVGIEFRPGNPAVVHHAIVFLDASGRARARDAATPEPGWRTSGSIDASITSVLGVWTPGMTPRFYPDGVGNKLDKGADVVVQLHLHPSGKIETDRSRIALYFAKKPVAKLMPRNPLLLGSLAIEIPPGETRHRLGSKITLPVDLTLTSVLPHMHLIGREMKITATLPDGAAKPLLWIKEWNFYWQDSYVYGDPVRLPKGTVLEIEAWYDNSADNPFNPQMPPQRVLFGNATTDEMCFALFQAVADQPGGMREMGRTMMQTMMQEWNSAPLSADARGRIMAEILKLAGGRRPGIPVGDKKPDAPANKDQ